MSLKRLQCESLGRAQGARCVVAPSKCKQEQFKVDYCVYLLSSASTVDQKA